MNTIKCLKVDDVFFMKLPVGTFLVDGEIVTAGYGGIEIQCSSNEIIEVSKTSIPTHYENAEGDKKSLEEYEAELADVKSRGIGSDCDWDFENDNDFLIYRNLTKRWSRCYRYVVQYSEPLPIEVKPVTMDTGCIYINPVLGFKEFHNGVYVYNRSGFCRDKMQAVFKELGMVYEGKVGYQQTEGKKIWGNSTHSHMRYVTAFGRYIFNKEYSGEMYGTLERLKAESEADGNEIERIIKSGYAKHFSGALIDVDNVLSKMQSILRLLWDIESKKKTYHKMSSARSLASKLIKDCEEYLAKQVIK